MDVLKMGIIIHLSTRVDDDEQTNRKVEVTVKRMAVWYGRYYYRGDYRGDSVKLTDLDPRLVSHGGEGISDSKTGEPIPERKGVGMTFDCPCGDCHERCYLQFTNPLDGGEECGGGHPTWQRTGEDFETMTLTPSIQRMGDCRWHGYLTNGELKEC